MIRPGLAFLSVCGLVLAGCSSSSAPRHSAGNVLTWFTNTGGDAWVTTLDPATAANSMSMQDIELVNANLVRLDPDSLTPVPDLAMFRASPDRRTWTFTLRPAARFSNGDEVMASDAAWSLTRALLPQTQSTVAMTYLGHIVGATAVATGKARSLSGVTVEGKRVLRITLDSPILSFLAALSRPVGVVLDRRIMQGQPADDYLTNTCAGNVGAGPFRFVCRNGGGDRSSFYATGKPAALDLAPNPYYYGRKPTLHLHLPFIPNPETAWSQFRRGLLDGVPVPAAHLPAARRMPGFLRAPLLQTDSIVPNLMSPPFNNLNCRLAVAYAIDRTRIASRVLGGAAAPLYGVVPHGLVGYLPAGPGIPRNDPARARAYLSRCPGRLRGATLAYDSGDPEVTKEYRAIRDELRAIGALITLVPLGFHDWLNVYGHGLSASGPPLDLFQFLWIADYPDPQDWCEPILHTGGSFDLGGFTNPSYDRLVDAAGIEPSPDRRAALYRQAQRVALESGAWIAVDSAYGTYLVSSRLHGMTVTADGIQPRHGDWSKVSLSG